MVRGARCRLLVLVAVPLTPATAPAQGPSSQTVPGVFRLLSGTWVGEGTLLGRAGSFRMSWEVSPAGQIRLDFTNLCVDDSGVVTRVLEAVAIYPSNLMADGSIRVPDWGPVRRGDAVVRGGIVGADRLRPLGCLA